MTLDEARLMVAQTESPTERAAAEQLLDEAIALPQLPPAERAAAFARIRRLEPTVPDYQLRSFGASMLEIVGDSVIDPAVKKALYGEAVNLAEWYASGATSGGEGTARSRHVREIEAKLRALETGSSPAGADGIEPSGGPQAVRDVPASGAPPPPPRGHGPRPLALTAVGWTFIGAGALGIPISAISSLMILAGAPGSASGSFLGGLVVIAGPAATLVAGIGLLRRRRWAYGYALGVPALCAAYNLVQLLRSFTPERSTVSPDGVIHTELVSGAYYAASLLFIAISVGLLVVLLAPAVRTQFSD